MKKSILAATLTVCALSAANAQYRPESGAKALEVNFAPLGGSPVSLATGIKYRQFTSQTSVLRLGVFLGHSSEGKVTQDENSTLNQVELRDRKSSTNISIQPGIEKHFAGTERLSPYVGGFVNIGYGRTSEKKETQFGDNKVGYNLTKGGSFNFGLNAVAGFDFYVAQSLYLGTEIGFGFGLNSEGKKKVETLSYNADGNSVTTDGESRVGTGSNWQIGPNVVGQLRLGWLF